MRVLLWSRTSVVSNPDRRLQIGLPEYHNPEKFYQVPVTDFWQSVQENSNMT
jgi:hypothetical protein